MAMISSRFYFRQVSISIYFLLTIVSYSVLSQPLSGTKKIGTTGDYSNLTLACADAQAKGISASLIFELQPSYSSNNESFPITIGFIPGSSPTNTLTIRPQLGATGLSIVSASKKATIDLNNASYIIIDGRPGGVGAKNLIIANTADSGSSIRFINDACFNTIKQTVLCGQNGANNNNNVTGIVFFAGTNLTRGNDSNTVDSCDLRDYNGSMPSCGLLSSSNTSINDAYNSNNIISNCNFFNIWTNTSGYSNPLYLYQGSTDWTITGNSFYQVGTRTITAATNRNYFLTISGSTGNNFTISKNYLGGSAPFCGGTPYTVTGATTLYMYTFGMSLACASTKLSYVTDNTIQNVDLTSGANATSVSSPGSFSGINTSSGAFVIQNNNIGDQTKRASIKLTYGAVTSIYLINYIEGNFSSIPTIIRGNKIGGIEVNTTVNTIGHSITGIYALITSNNNNLVIDSNTVGNNLIDNIISKSLSNANGTNQYQVGISVNGNAGYFNIRRNTIQNFRNNAIGGSPTNYYSYGIVLYGNGIDTVIGNTIHDISNATNYPPSNLTIPHMMIGIFLSTTSSGNYLANNTIYNLKHTSNTVNTLISSGMVSSSAGYATLDGNFIKCITNKSTNIVAAINGIFISKGSICLLNNIIHLGVDSAGNSITNPITLNGIYNTGTIKAINNTVYIAGNNVLSNNVNTYAFFNTGTYIDSLANNIFINNRSNLSNGGKHLAFSTNSISTNYINFNNYWVNPVNTYYGLFNNVPVSLPSSWYNTTGYDSAQYYYYPSFKNETGNYTSIDLHLSGVGLKGAPNKNVAKDIDGDKRFTFPDLGADELANDVGIVSIDSPGTATFCGRSRGVYITFKNYSSTVLNSCIFNIAINNNLVTSIKWTGNLASNATTNSTLLTTIPFTGGLTKLSVYISQPNGGLDTNATNDTSSVRFTVIPTVTPSAYISTFSNSVCLNASTKFSAVMSNIGSSPVFTWKKNGITVSTDSTYTTSTLANADSISFQLVSNAPCATQSIIDAKPVKMIVGSSLAPAISIQQNNNAYCSGSLAIFNCDYINGGFNPQFQWFKNGISVGNNAPTYQYTSSQNKDTIRVILTSNLSCASKLKDTSAFAYINITPTLTPTITINASATSLCAGIQDTFRSVYTNPGDTPIFQWRINGATLANRYHDTLIVPRLNNNDIVFATLLSSEKCVSSSIVNSNNIQVAVLPKLATSDIIITPNNNLCTGDSSKIICQYQNAGSNPVVEWYKNGQLITTTYRDSFYYKPLLTNDTIYTVVKSNYACAINPVVSSNKIGLSLNTKFTPSVSISANANNFCFGTSAQFVATPVNAGVSPVYTWLLNGQSVGSNSLIYTSDTLHNNDKMQLMMNITEQCSTKPIDTSNSIFMIVKPVLPTSVIMSTLNTSICTGQAITFKANPTNGGTTPHYQWWKNTFQVGSDSVNFTSNNINNLDSIYVVMTSNVLCPSPTNARSPAYVFNVNPIINASVSMVANNNPICIGNQVIFTASALGGGTSPSYAWKVNGNLVGTNASTYTTSSLSNLDSISVDMTSSYGCANPPISKSNKVKMTVYPIVTPTIWVTTPTPSACLGTNVTYTAVDSFPGPTPSYIWLKNTFVVGTDNPVYSTTPTKTDLIQCVLISNAPCATRNFDTSTSTLLLYPNPSKPIVTRKNDTLSSSPSQGYQWFLNTSPITSGTNQQLIITSNGNYRVTVDSNGCKNTSDIFVVKNLSVIDAATVGTISLSPNPTQYNVLINADFIVNDKTSLEIFDVTGKQIQQFQLGNIQSLSNYNIDMDNYQSGIYFIYVKHGDHVATYKIMKSE